MFNNTQRLAWMTLIVAFVVFCGIAFGFFMFTRYVLFDWTLDLQTTMNVSRGTAGLLQNNDLTERIVRDTYELSSRDQVSVDELSQASISFVDPLDNDHVVATLTMRANSRVELETAKRPRFFGDNPYEINLKNISGDLELVIASDLNRDIRFRVINTLGEIHIDQAGAYQFSAQDDGLRVTTTRGVALIVAQDRTAQLVHAGQVGQLTTEAMTTSSLPSVNFVANADLIPPEGNPEGVPRPWGCTNQAAPDNPEYTPLGDVRSTIFQGRDTIYIRRVADFQLLPAETACEQLLGGLDIREYDSLRIQVRAYLVDHSVPGCGQAGTECALMVHLRYRNELDAAIVRDWRQGFYVRSNEGLNWPNRCDTCTAAHLHVRPNVWYTFESVDLIQDLTADQSDLRPVVLESIEFYASGHAYEVYVDEISLIGIDFDGNATVFAIN